jgi:hypothetical protein
MFDQINHQQEKLFNLSKIILIVVALIMSFIIIYFMFFHRNSDSGKDPTSTAEIENVDTGNMICNPF